MTTAHAHPLATNDRVRSVSRALEIVDILAAHPEGLTAKGIAYQANLAVPTTYHLLNTLAAAGYVARDSHSRHFTLGPRIPQLYRAFLDRARPSLVMQPLMQALREATGCTIHLNQLYGDDVVSTAIVSGDAPRSIDSGYVGLSLPAHLTATGLVLLAYAGPERATAYLNGRYGHSAGPFPAADAAWLQDELSRVRATGYAIDRDRGQIGLWCLAAPIHRACGAVDETLAILANRETFANHHERLLASLLTITRTASEMTDLSSAADRATTSVSTAICDAAALAIEGPP